MRRNCRVRRVGVYVLLGIGGGRIRAEKATLTASCVNVHAMKRRNPSAPSFVRPEKPVSSVGSASEVSGDERVGGVSSVVVGGGVYAGVARDADALTGRLIMGGFFDPRCPYALWEWRKRLQWCREDREGFERLCNMVANPKRMAEMSPWARDVLSNTLSRKYER